MGRGLAIVLALAVVLTMGLAALWPNLSAQPATARVASDNTVTGFAFPESVACDTQGKVLYVSEFGSELKPTEKDGKGRISKVSFDGKVIDKQFLPAAGGVLHKPKGSWVQGNRLWVTDIDAVWVFDLTTRQGRKADLPGSKFANDLALKGDVLYVTDNQGDQLFRVEPADFLKSGSPKVSVVFTGKSINPNGVYPARDGSMLLVGFASADQPRGIYAVAPDGEVKTLAKDLGRLDGVYQMDDGSLLLTEWNSGSLSRWSAATGLQPLAKEFKGPADFCVVPDGQGLLVVVPDLVKSELRLVRLAR